MTTQIDALHRQLNEAKTTSERIDALNALAWEIREHHIEQSIGYLDEARSLAETEYYTWGILCSLITTGYLKIFRGAFEGGLETALRAKALYTQLEKYDDPEKFTIILYTMGMAYRNLGNYPSALEQFFEMLTFAEHHELMHAQGAVHKEIGLAYTEMGDYEKATYHNELSLSIHRSRGYMFGQVNVLTNHCSVLIAQKQFDTALDYIEQSLNLIEQGHGAHFKPFVLMTLGKIHRHLAHYHQALAYLEASRSAFQIAPQVTPHYRSEIHYEIANVHTAQQANELALAEYQTALSLATENNVQRVISLCLQGLAEVSEAKGDVQQALDYYKQYQRAKDSLFSEEQQLSIRNLEVLQRTQKLETAFLLQEHRREQDRKYYERLSKLKDDLLSTVSHDLKNPLASIHTSLHLLRRHNRVDDEQGSRYLTNIEMQANRMNQLIGDLLELEKMKTHELEIERIHLKSFLESILQHFQVMADSRNIHIQFRDEEPDLFLEFDPKAIRHVLENLLSNALKYNQEGGKIELIVERNSVAIYIKVVDTGVGIPQKDIPHLFERFYRVQSSTVSVREGSGLGLAIVKTLVEKHGGELWVDSEVDKGSTFKFSLPSAVSPASA